VTERIKLVTYITVAPYRNPLLLAKTAATVDLISNGRFILGMGTGYLKSEFFALGVQFDERNELLDEVLDVLPLHWSGERFSYEGKHFSAHDVVARPSPRSGTIPIWIGGNARVSRRRAARVQGWMPMIGPPTLASTTRTPHISSLDDIAAAVREIKELAGGRADQIDITVLYADDSILDTKADVERHRDEFERMAEAGITWVAFAWDFSTEAETMRFIDGFAAHYLGRDRV
jgi:probable F420-dependent oxidoreductase